MAHIAGLIQPGTAVKSTYRVPVERPESTRLAAGDEIGTTDRILRDSSLRSRLDSNPIPLVMARPQPVNATFSIAPNSHSSNWDETLGRALQVIDSPESWSLLGRGPGLLSGSENTVQRAEYRLQSGPTAARFQTPEVQNPLGQMSFSATLESGARITFEVNADQGYGRQRSGSMAYRLIDVSYASDAELTEAERAALDEFSLGLGRFAGDFARNGAPDVALLNLTDSPVLTDIKLSMQTRTDSMALSYQSDADGRQLDLKWNLKSLSMSIDGDALAGSGYNEALNDVRRTITESLGKARSSQSDQNVIIKALSLFGGMSKVGETEASIPMGGEALLTGLPDYDIRFNGAAEAPEGLKYNEHFQKYSGVRSFEMSQATRITEHNGRQVIDQTQVMALDAAYFTALPHLELPDFDNENFNWTVISERQEATTQQVWEDNELVSAQMWRSTQSQQLTETWSEGQQIDRIEDPIDRQQLDDLAHWVESRRKDDRNPSPERSGFNVTHHWLG